MLDPTRDEIRVDGEREVNPASSGGRRVLSLGPVRASRNREKVGHGAVDL